MKKAQREKLAATMLQRYVRGWRVRSKFPQAKWRRERALRKERVAADAEYRQLLLDIDSGLKAYVLEDASSKFFFPESYDKTGRSAVLERARQLGFDCGEERNGKGKTVAFVQRPPERTDASADASASVPAAADTLGDSPGRSTTEARRTASSAGSASASAAPPAAEPQTTARAGSKAKARWWPLDVSGHAGASTDEAVNGSAWGATPAEPPRSTWTAEAVPPPPVWTAGAVPGRKAAQELAEMTGLPLERCLQALEDCNFDSNAAANVLLSQGPPTPEARATDARPTPSAPLPAPLSDSIPAPAPPQPQPPRHRLGTLPAPLSDSIPAAAPPQPQPQSQRPRTPDAVTELAAARAAALAAAAEAEAAEAEAAGADLAAPAAAPPVPPATLFRVSHTLLTATLSAGARPGGGTLQMRVPSTAESRRVTNEAPLLLFDKERRELLGVFSAAGPIGDDGVLHFRWVKKPRPRTAPPHHAAPPHHVAYSSPHHPLIAPHRHPPGEAVPAAGRGGVRRPARVCRRRAAPHARTRRSQAALRGLQQAGAPCSTQHHVHMHMCMHMHMHTHVHVHMRVVTHACPPTNEQALLDRQAAVLEPSAADAGQEAAASVAARSAAGGAVAASTAGAASASGESVQAPR